MNKRLGIFLFASAFLLIAIGCTTFGSAGHKYFMKGQVLETTDGQAYLCIGSAEGAQAGQEFAVYHYEKTRAFSGKQSQPAYTREKVGTIRIRKVVDEHYAWATVLKGIVTAGDVAELKW
jgi:hypothetical protein